MGVVPGGGPIEEGGVGDGAQGDVVGGGWGGGVAHEGRYEGQELVGHRRARDGRRRVRGGDGRGHRGVHDEQKDDELKN